MDYDGHIVENTKPDNGFYLQKNRRLLPCTMRHQQTTCIYVKKGWQHARKLQGYLIESRKFAEMFRTKFLPYANAWPNVSVNYSPLTLMEGWIKINQHDLVDTIIIQANKFLEIECLVDYTLINFRRKRKERI